MHCDNKLPYDDLETEHSETERRYIVAEGKSYPSVTTVLGAFGDKSGLIAWRKRVGEEEANRITRLACTRGTNMHNACEKYLGNSDKWFQPNEMPLVKSLFETIQPVLDKRVDNVYSLEVALYSHHLELAGRVDVVAEFDGKLSVIDFKTSKAPKRVEHIQSYFMQSSAYAIMFEERTGIPVAQTVIIIAADNSPGRPQVFINNRDDYTKPLLSAIEHYKSLS